jgi:hypothetical protein
MKSPEVDMISIHSKYYIELQPIGCFNNAGSSSQEIVMSIYSSLPATNHHILPCIAFSLSWMWLIFNAKYVVVLAVMQIRRCSEIALSVINLPEKGKVGEMLWY